MMNQAKILELKEALQAAHDAGNVEDATALVARIDELQAEDDNLQKIYDESSKQTTVFDNPLYAGVPGAAVGAAAAPVKNFIADIVAVDQSKPPAPNKPSIPPVPVTEHGVGYGAVKNAEHNVGQVLKNKVDLGALDTPGYSAPGNSLILRPNFMKGTPLEAPAAPPAAPQPKGPIEIAKARARTMEHASTRPMSLLGNAGKGAFGAAQTVDAIQQAKEGNIGNAALDTVGIAGLIGQGLAKTKRGRALSGLAAWGAPAARGVKEYVSTPEYAKGGKVGALEALVKKAFDPRFDSRVLEQEKLKNLTRNVEHTGVKDIPRINLPDYEGHPFITSMSDRTAGGSRLLGVNDVKFNRPVELTGGQEFMYNNPGMAWASGKNPVNQIMREATALKQSTGKDPLYMPWRMAPTASDFAHMTGETMLAHADSVMSAAQKKDLNNTVRKFIPDWKGIEDPTSLSQFHGASANARKGIQNAIDRDLRGSGALGIGETRLAIADPNQIAAPEGGLMHVARIHADKPVIDKSGNVTYPFGVPGEGIGQLNKDHIVTEMLPGMVSERGIANPLMPSAQDLRALQMKPYSGIIDDKLLKSLGYAEGGSTSPAWQRKEGKNPEGGLNAAGRASYNRETGGNLKAPQPEGGPRKKSFCARMEGMKKKNTSSATANDPDSRINKSLRKWKC